MQLKGLVKLFTALLILISLYQLSFTYLVNNVEKAYRAKAFKQVKATNPAVTSDKDPLVDERFAALTDSLQGEKVVSMLFMKYTYQEAKAQELNLGLDLQGGMNVTLDVSLDELVRSLSNNPSDPALLAAIHEANIQKANSQADFVTLFGQAYKGGHLASLFTKPGETEIKLGDPDEKVLRRIRTEASEAIVSTYNVLQKRIDKFGVSQPNVTLDKNRGIISVELAGVRNPDRVREFLQSTAKLQFFEIYEPTQALYDGIKRADEALSVKLYGTDLKKNIDTAHAGIDSGKLGKTNPDSTQGKTLQQLAKGSDANDTSIETIRRKHPLLSLFQPMDQPPVFARMLKSNVQKFLEYDTMDVVKSALPIDAKFCLGAEDAETRYDAKAPVYIYIVKTLPGTGDAKLEGEHVVNARMDFDPTSNKPEVLMEMDPTGANIWAKMTRENVNKYLAVVLDDRVYSAPLNHEEIAGGRTSISGGNGTAQTYTDLANILKIGKLPAPAHIVQEQVVGPTLGAENIKSGLASLAIAFVVIFLLMLVYYNTGGIVANIALILNILFTVGILSALHATLTMPGIAGLVLTIGMAVDTNVIIFERIKEELSLGKSYQLAVADGYKRSYSPVFDGHITQLLTAIILFIFGLGPVKGFATTQIIGLLLSLFCGILVSRLVTDTWTKRERHFQYFTALSKSIFRKAHFKFIEARKYTYVISGIVFLLGIGSFFNGYDYGVDFAGGRSYDIRFEGKHTVTEIKEKMKPFFGTEPVVKTIGTNNTFNITTSYLIKDPNKEASDQVRAKLYDGLKAGNFIPASTTMADFQKQYLGGTGQERTVLPIISEDLKRGAVKATIISLLAIFFYILVRFRKWQYSLGTIISLLHDACITLAVFSFLRGHVPFALEIDQHFIAALLTVIGFSMNDTVIVFDRVREYFRKSPGEGKKSVINRAINDTLSRTIMTSLTVFLTVLILFIFGGEVTRGFAFAMLIGVFTGTYSSIFVAAPILVDMDKSDSLKNEVDKDARIEELKKLA